MGSLWTWSWFLDEPARRAESLLGLRFLVIGAVMLAVGWRLRRRFRTEAQDRPGFSSKFKMILAAPFLLALEALLRLMNWFGSEVPAGPAGLVLLGCCLVILPLWFSERTGPRLGLAAGVVLLVLGGLSSLAGAALVFSASRLPY
jgi:hypothetical protein